MLVLIYKNNLDHLLTIRIELIELEIKIISHKQWQKN